MRLLKPGDRVIVIAGDPCCGNSEHVGLIFTIMTICPPENGYAICNKCEAIFDEPMAWLPNQREGRWLGFLLETLQLIDPDPTSVEEKKIEEPVRG